MSFVSHEFRSIFSPPIRWAIRVLAWLAFLGASYLAWNALHGTSVAGCGVGERTGCDVVLASSWARWLGLPVAFGGLACYAALAGLSVLVGWGSDRFVRWIDTLTMLLSLVAGGASLWFVGLQLLVIGEICRFCLFVDLCGIAIGGLVLASLARSASLRRGAKATDQGIKALRSVTVPRGSVPLSVTTASRSSSGRAPAGASTGLAFGGAIALIAVLIGGQLMFPSKTYEIQSVALDQPIDLTSTASDSVTAINAAHLEDATTGRSHTTMRISTESDTSRDQGVAKEGGEEPTTDPDDPTAAAEPESGAASGESASEAEEESPSPSVPKRERIVKFLNGKLSLNIYDHPVLGNPEAPHVVVEMLSYDCPHCRDMHRIVQRGLKRYGDQLAIVVLVMPLEMSCNKLVTDPKASHDGACTIARMALGISAVNPTTFRSFHDWLMADEKKPPTKSQAVAKAYRLVDSRRLRDITGSDEIKKQIDKYVDLFATLRRYHRGEAKSFGLPIQIVGDEMMTGKVEKASDVYKTWEKNLGINPR
jgi:uncharacterized membrane protein